MILKLYQKNYSGQFFNYRKFFNSWENMSFNKIVAAEVHT